MKDTTPRIEERQREMLLALSPEERLKMTCSMHSAAKALALAGIRASHPSASESELRSLLFLRFYGDDFTAEERERVRSRLAGVPHPTRDAPV